MKKSIVKRIWRILRKQVSIFIILAMLITSMTPALRIYAAKEVEYFFADEVEVDETLIDDDMFYMPHKVIEAKEGDDNNKYVFRVRRKGNGNKASKVKLTMVDISGKYDRDYSVRVIDKAIFSEDIQNANVSKSIDEYMKTSGYEEYNILDALIDGSVKSEDVMTDEEKENYVISDEEKENLFEDANVIFSEENIDATIESINGAEPENPITKNSSAETNKSEETGTKITEPSETTETKVENGEIILGAKENNSTENDSKENIDINDKITEVEETTEAINIIKNENIDNSQEDINNSLEKNNQINEETVSGFTNTDTGNIESEHSTEASNVENSKAKLTTTEESTTIETSIEASSNEETTIEETTSTELTSTSKETTSKEITSEEPTSEESINNKSITEESLTVAPTTVEPTTTEPKVQETKQETSLNETEKNELTNKEQITTNKKYIATESEIIYGDEEVEFTIPIATMSISDSFEMATGLKNDRKKVDTKRDMGSILGLNPNSIEDPAFMKESVETVAEELKSAYIILEFNASQTEKLIELTIKDDKKYYGDRQVGFNLSPLDDSLVAGMYASITLTIHDDEEETPTYINFTKTSYEPKDGYVVIEVERSGDLGSIATCMIDTFDITAKSGRDYAKVHSELIFGFGINNRRIKIPVITKYIKGEASFELKLQEPSGALIGDKNRAVCTIKETDKSFEPKRKEDETKKSENNLFGDGTTSSNENNLNLFGAPGDDYSMSSVKYAPVLNLEKDEDSFWTNGHSNSNSYKKYSDKGTSMEVYIEDKRGAIEQMIDGESSAWYRWGVDPKREKYPYSYAISGVELNWKCNTENEDFKLTHHSPGETSVQELIHRTRATWDGQENFFFSQWGLGYFDFKLIRYDGVYRTHPKLNLRITPIFRMYNITLAQAEAPALIGANGQDEVDTGWLQTNFTEHLSDGTAVAWAEKTVTVELKETRDNPYFFKALKICNGTEEKEIAVNISESATQLSFKIDEDFLRENDSFIHRIHREGGGKNGAFTIKPVLDAKKAKVEIVRDDRVDVKIWDGVRDIVPTESNEHSDIYEFKIGDVLQFTTEITAAYQTQFTCGGILVEEIDPETTHKYTIERDASGSFYSPLKTYISGVRLTPKPSPVGNIIQVRVDKNIINKFDTTKGIFTKPRIDGGSYWSYVVENDSNKIVGRYFDFEANCRNENHVPVWRRTGAENIKFMQEDFYYYGVENKENNIIYLGVETGNAIEYSIAGTAYYEDVKIGGQTEDRYWEVAEGVGVVIDDGRFAYSDSSGRFTTIAGKGKEGYYNRLKVVSNGREKYVDVLLNNNHRTTRTWTISYETGDETITEEVYLVDIGEMHVSNITKTHPYISSVDAANTNGVYSNHIYINDAITTITAKVNNRDINGNLYRYSYIDANGNEVFADEQVKRVEFVVVNTQDHTIKKVIQATMSNADLTEWTAYYSFERGHYAEYYSDDEIYARVVTDKKVGDGRADDITTTASNARRVVDVFNETTYQSIKTGITFVEQSETEPYRVDFAFPADQELPIQIPIIGDLATAINANGMIFQIETTTPGRIRLKIGMKLKAKASSYDDKGSPADDTGYKITLANVDQSIEDMTNIINKSGNNVLGAMSLGMTSWKFQPVIGVYFEFEKRTSATAPSGRTFRFVGGGGYLGGKFELRAIQYFCVYGIPCYIGCDIALTFSGEFGLAVDKETTAYAGNVNRANQDFFDDLMAIDGVHFEYVFKAKLAASAYAGIGIAGVLGIRGGFELDFTFLYNPFIHKSYNNVRPVGFAITGAIKFWADAVLLSIPIPVYKWKNPLKLGYFEDIDNIPSMRANNRLLGSGDTSQNPLYTEELKPKPRFGGHSTFVANEQQDNELFGGTYQKATEVRLIQDVYDNSEPKLIKYNDNNVLLVYLDDDGSRSELERTSLRYMIYDIAADSWYQPLPQPQNIDGDSTADFSPYLCDCGDKILLTWTSRPEVIDEQAEKKELLSNMEVYTVFFDKATGSFGNVERMTFDDAFDYYPKAQYDAAADMVHLYYLKKTNVTDINNGDDLLDNVQTETNDSYLMYMTYADIGDGQGKRWLTDYYYDYELPSSLTPDERQAFITQWRGQRFKNLSTHITGTDGTDNPNISDYDVSYAKIFDTTDIMTEINDFRLAVENTDFNTQQSAIENFENNNSDKFKHWNVTAYVVEEDGDVNTKNDTELYVKLQCATESNAKTIRLTRNNVPDGRPKIIRNNNNTYIFWIQNESTIKMADVNSLILKAEDENQSINELETGSVSIFDHVKTASLEGKISDFSVFVDPNNNVYVIWQQNANSKFIDEDTGEISFIQDLWIAGFIETLTSTGERVRSWAPANNFTFNSKVNNLPTMANIGDSLLMVNNQYNLKSSEQSYIITNSNLVAGLYSPASSLMYDSIDCNVDTINSDGSIRYKSNIKLSNDGLFEARGYNYEGYIYYDEDGEVSDPEENILINFSGTSTDEVLPGAATTIDQDIYFTLTSEQQQHLENVDIYIKVVESDIGDVGIRSNADVFIEERKYTFVSESEQDSIDDSKKLYVNQVGDNFVINGVLKNSGTVPSFGNAKIYVINQDDWEHPIAETDYINLPVNGQMQFSIPVSNTLFKEDDYGFKDLVLFVKNDDGEILSDYEIATMNAYVPYNFKVNGSSEVVNLKVGDILTLNGTYKPSERYENATVLYSVEDTSIAMSSGNTLYGVNVGETTMKLTTREFGGNHEVKVIVSPKSPTPAPRPYYSGGGRSGGGGGGGGGMPLVAQPKVTEISTIKNILAMPDASQVSWAYDPISNQFKLNISVENNTVPAMNGFYVINRMATVDSNGNKVQIPVTDTYYFDSNGNMITGWIHTTIDDKWYFFEQTKNIREGQMYVSGWYEIQGKWYYFTVDGSMLVNATTPDGFFVGADGAWVQQ